MLRKRPSRSGAAGSLGLLALSIATVGAIACTEIGTSPTVPVALAFDTLPSPSVVYGDTLRDINGVAAKLTGHAYNADGNEIANANIRYLLTDGTTATIDTVTDYLVATSDTTKKTIVLRAQVNSIPSLTPRTLEIVPSPDTVDRQGIVLTRTDTLNYAATDTSVLLNASLLLRVLDRPNPAKPDSGLRGVRSYLVKYSVVSPAGADSLLVDESGRKSRIDTTSTDGVAARKIRIRASRGGNLATGVPDTVIVEGTARNRDGVLPGAPIRYLIILKKNP